MKFLPLLVAGLVWLTPAFVERVADRCTGEASFAVEACACTVKNRIDVGWNPAKVLNAYYAPDIASSADSQATVAAILAGETDCPDTYYYIWSSSDLRYIGLDERNASDRHCEGDRCVFTFPRSALR